MQIGKAATKLALALICSGALTSAKADDTYNFTYNSTSGQSIQAAGTFTIDNAFSITSATGYFNAYGSTMNINLGYGSFNGSFIFGGFQDNLGNTLILASNSYFTQSGNISSSSDTSGSAVPIDNGHDYGDPNSLGNFTASLFSSGPAGGSGGGSSGGSGGAPSPEVNALLGIALAAGTVAFLRRKRRRHDGALAA